MAERGIDQRQIGELEAGRLDPTFDVLLALAEGIGVQLSTLIPNE